MPGAGQKHIPGQQKLKDSWRQLEASNMANEKEQLTMQRDQLHRDLRQCKQACLDIWQKQGRKRALDESEDDDEESDNDYNHAKKPRPEQEGFEMQLPEDASATVSYVKEQLASCVQKSTQEKALKQQLQRCQEDLEAYKARTEERLKLHVKEQESLKTALFQFQSALIKLPCTHKFCTKCLMQWVHTKLQHM
ncbi:hypothetical protein WJX73_000492 [Symbiochloris irregularis]|uniref:Zinc finger C3HC4 RING-type domain-containing protein n=1 Tax=Symbiochloris irregularis TaxID=706552 RepID=A0AAW1NVX8_9CHLO